MPKSRDASYSRGETAGLARSMFGDKLYQRRAREALPLLVRQATAKSKITYGHLAAEMGIANARTLNYVLGSIGTTLRDLGKKWGEDIPPIQTLVVNQETGLPGHGVNEFLIRTTTAEHLDPTRKKALVIAALDRVFAYRKWPEVLVELDLDFPLPNTSLTQKIEAASRMGRGGESNEHKEAKLFISTHPWVIGVRDGSTATIEFALPSGDRLDVLFRGKKTWTASEVKSRISNEEDIIRGLFQCVKYQAILSAYLCYLGQSASTRTVLALEADFPQALLGLRNVLDVEVIDNFRDRDGP